jgi:hypothetical protein
LSQHCKSSHLINLLSDCLRAQPSSLLADSTHAELCKPEIWSKLVERALAHHVAPLLFRRANTSNLLATAPAEIAEFLNVTDRLNGARNAALLEQTVEFAEALDRIGILPIVLKGGAFLFDEPLADENAVMLSDLDLLVQADQVEQAVGGAISLGYTVSSAVPGGHSVVLCHPERVASIDLHHDLGPQRHVLAAEEAMRRAEKAGAFSVRRLSPTDRAIHNIYHAQIQNRNYRLAILSLHQLCNFGLLVGRYGSEIDWDIVSRRFDRCGYKSHFHAYLYSAERLLGIKTSARFSFARKERMHFKRIMLQMDWPWLHNLSTYPAILNSGRTEDRIAYKRAKGLPIQSSTAAVVALAVGALRRHRHMVFAKLAAVHRSQFGRR